MAPSKSASIATHLDRCVSGLIAYRTDGYVAVKVHPHHAIIDRFRFLGLPVPRRVIRNGTVRQWTLSLVLRRLAGLQTAA